MAACRNVGIPARYVSGYQTGDAGHAEHDLHAWSEAYLPGAGWRGFDPTAGLWVAEHHVTLCAAHHPDLTTPVDGSFRGEAESTMDHVIRYGHSDLARSCTSPGSDKKTSARAQKNVRRPKSI